MGTQLCVGQDSPLPLAQKPESNPKAAGWGQWTGWVLAGPGGAPGGTGREGDAERANPLSTFCYLSAQRDALGQLVHGHLAVEVTLLGATLHLVDDDRPHHAGDEEGPRAVDDDFQIQGRRHHRRSFLQG